MNPLLLGIEIGMAIGRTLLALAKAFQRVPKARNRSPN